MAITKRIVCLANSRKLNERCVAGKELAQGQPARWIRPVSVREHGELSRLDRQYDDGSDPQVLDIMDVPLLKAEPKGYQQENWALDGQHRWQKVGSTQWLELQHLADSVEPLWTNGHKTAKGLNDEVPLPEAVSLTSSLRLLRVPELTLSVFDYYKKRWVQGRFQHAGTEYWLWVTDPSYEGPYKKIQDGDYVIGECFLTISLSEPFTERNACYKLIAAIIQHGGGSGT